MKPPRKRFVIVHNSLKTVWLFRKEYIKRLLSNGHVVVVISPEDDKHAYDRLLNMGVIMRCFDFESGFKKILSIYKMNRLIVSERNNGSTFICHFLITYIYTFLSFLAINQRLYLYVEGMGSFAIKHSLIRRFLTIIIRASGCNVLYCNKNDMSDLKVPGDVIGGIGIDLDKFQIKSINQVSKFQINMLYVGRLIGDKGVWDSIEVLSLLRKSGLNVKLTLVGETYPNNPSSLSDIDLRELKERFSDSICFAGFQKSTVEWYRLADVMVLPSIREGFPVSAMEASAMGLQTFGYKTAGMNEAVSESINGNLVELGDVSSLAQKISDYFHKSPEEKRVLKILCREHAEQNFCRKKISREFVKRLVKK
ncbi:hypothetical protein A6E01_17535 [Vibrio breoganii]|uniref:Glycosyl transferase family 1 domain-containing protein n=1 Tax=Vibrio breoganii TaxID=553239 RepID=A0AAN0XY81_9VIBR|nr:glycosyltransferase [Vibrio breoganii]ANO34977.1 hypothetical protein A6E01_17535 [Vibrio breoganii]